MALRYRSDTGALVLFSAESGLLMEDCCCDADSVCHSCDPGLKRQYNVTLSGLAGSFSFANGVTTLTNFTQEDNPCWWGTYPVFLHADQEIFLFYVGAEGAYTHKWRLVIHDRTGGESFCHIRLDAEGDYCNPWDGLVYDDITTCVDSGCGNLDSCTDSVGASGTIAEA